MTLQTWEPLTGKQKQELVHLHVQIQEYVSENTYLCRYEPADSENTKAKPFVSHVAEYDTRFKRLLH